MTKIGTLVIWLSLALSGSLVPSHAQKPLEEMPGFFPVDELNLVKGLSVTSEIELHGPVLRLVETASRDEDAAFAALLADLHAVRVREAVVAKADWNSVRAQLREAERWLLEQRWQRSIQIRETNEELLIYTRTVGGTTEGFVFIELATDGLTVVNLIGDVDLQQLGLLAAGLRVPRLDHTIQDDAAQVGSEGR